MCVCVCVLTVILDFSYFGGGGVVRLRGVNGVGGGNGLKLFCF